MVRNEIRSSEEVGGNVWFCGSNRMTSEVEQIEYLDLEDFVPYKMYWFFHIRIWGKNTHETREICCAYFIYFHQKWGFFSSVKTFLFLSSANNSQFIIYCMTCEVLIVVGRNVNMTELATTSGDTSAIPEIKKSLYMFNFRFGHNSTSQRQRAV